MEINYDGIPEQDVNALDNLIRLNSSKGMTVIELGTYTGKSSVTILPYVKKNNGTMYCIDWFKGMTRTPDEIHNSYKEHNILQVFLDRINNEGFDNNTITMVGTTGQAANIISDNIADIIFIDADHRYSCVRKDILNYWPKLKSEGIMCGHDFNKSLKDCNYLWAMEKCEESLDRDWLTGQPIHYGVVRAVTEFFQDVRWESNIWNVKNNKLNHMVELALLLEESKGQNASQLDPINVSNNFESNSDEEIFQKILKIIQDEDHDEYLIISAASILWNGGLQRTAFDLLEKMIDKKDESESILMLTLYSFFLTEIGKQDKAILILEKLSRIKPDDPVILNKLGECLFVMNQLSEAEQALSKAVSLDGCPLDVVVNLGVLHWSKGDKVRGFSLVKKAYAYPIGSYNLNTVLNLANMLSELGEGNKGIELLERFYEKSQDDRVLSDLEKLHEKKI